MQTNLPATRPATDAADAAIQTAELSQRQLRLWFLTQYQVNGISDRTAFLAKLVGVLDVACLGDALANLLLRHETLRMQIRAVDGVPRSHWPALLRKDLALIDLADIPTAARAEKLAEHCATLLSRSFDLGQGPLCGFELLRYAAEEHYLVFVAHPIVADERSTQILLDELAALYGNAGALLPRASTSSYADYVRAQNTWLSSADAQPELAFWQQTLQAPLPVLQLTGDRPRPPVLVLACAEVSFDLQVPEPKAWNTAFGTDADNLRLLTLTALILLLNRYSGQFDTIVGVQTHGRNQIRYADTVGPFATRLPLRVDSSGDPDVQTLLQRLQSALQDLQAHANVPLETIIELLHLARDQSRSPLFQVTYALHEVAAVRELNGGISLHEIPIVPAENEFDLSLHIYRNGPALQARLVYNKALFDASTVARMAAQYRLLLSSLTVDPARRISALPLLPAAEIEQLVHTWNQTARSFPQTRCAHQLFEEQVQLTPEATAVVAGRASLSFAQLNERANRLAHHLRRSGVGPDVIVGICIERSIDMAVALLGILKAGGAYLPLETNYPPERIEYMLRHAQPRLVLTQAKFLAAFAEFSPTLCLDRDAALFADEPDSNPTVSIHPDNLVYVIYTSGSTGRPKGVAITQRGLTNYLCWAIAEYRVAEGSGTPVHSPLSFDLTVTSLWTPLLTGKKAILLPDSEAEDALINCLRRERTLSLIKLTPAHVVLLSQVLSAEEVANTANALVIGGEALRGEMLQHWRQHSPRTRLINEYGPTETVVGCCIYEVPEGACPPGEILIGRPNANAQLYVLDPYLNLTPTGVPGELYIGGTGLARGYLNRPDLTAERFIPNPFGSNGERLYKTGDLARYQRDGNLEYLGRVDHQVKIRGYRIELGEIEAALLEQTGVREAVVIVRDDLPGGKQLVAYVALAAGSTTEALRSSLRERLPEYMLPGMFVQLDTLPLNKNGKVDRGALPRPDREAANQQEYVAPQGEIEAVLCSQWEALLDLPSIGRNDNFFQRGGHSLLAVRLTGAIEQHFGIKLPLASIFQAPTVAELAKLIETRGWNSHFYSLVPIQKHGSRPPLFAVHTLYLVDLPKRLGSDQPLYFLRYGMADTVADQPVPLPSVDDLAAHYLEEMRKVQPQGPYFMLGYSLGGIIAIEMARRLQAQGESVGLVAMLDTHLYAYSKRLPLTDVIQKILRLSWKEWQVRLKRRLAAHTTEAKFQTGYWPHRHSPSAETALARTYRPQLYVGDVALFKAEIGWDSLFHYHAPPEQLWRPYIQGELYVQTAPGDHTTMLQEPYVEKLVAALRERMDRALE